MDTKPNIFISTDAAVILSMLCQFMPNLFKCIVDLSGTKLFDLPFNLLTTQQIKEALENDPGLLTNALTALSDLQKLLIDSCDNLISIEKSKTEVSQMIVQLLAVGEAMKPENNIDEDYYADEELY